jgi:hypothetical protein
LYIIGHSGSSNLIAIATNSISGEKIIVQIIQATKSKLLFITLHQASSGVFLISINGILYNIEISVFNFVISKEFVIYLYLTQ